MSKRGIRTLALGWAQNPTMGRMEFQCALRVKSLPASRPKEEKSLRLSRRCARRVSLHAHGADYGGESIGGTCATARRSHGTSVSKLNWFAS